MAKGNDKCKDALFRRLFGSEDMIMNTISLYNALNGTDYDDSTDFQLMTIEDAVYIGMKHDVAFMIHGSIPLWEHQSTINPNMPLRGLLYHAQMLSEYVQSLPQTIYGKRLIKIPRPQFVVFYNGKDDAPDVQDLRLSDAFMEEDKSGKYEWTATVYNINKGKNDDLLAKCKPLRDYMCFVNYFREYTDDGYSLDDAVDKAVTRCIKEDILLSFLKSIGRR